MAFFKLKVRVYSNFASLFSVMKDNSSVIFSSNLILWTEIAHWSKILQLLSGWVKIHKIPDVIFETTSHFFFKLCSWKITLLYFFSWDFILFWRREPITVPNSWLSISPNCTLISSFCWKYIKFQIKNYRGVVSHDTEDWCKIWRKNNLLFQNWQNFGEILSEHSKVSKISTLIGSLRQKHVMFDLKRYRGVISHDTREWCKIWRKTNLWFGK